MLNDEDKKYADSIEDENRRAGYIEYVLKDKAMFKTKYEMGDRVSFTQIVHVNGEGFWSDRSGFISAKKIEVENKYGTPEIVAYYQVIKYLFDDLRCEKFKNDPGWIKESDLKLVPYHD